MKMVPLPVLVLLAATASADPHAELVDRAFAAISTDFDTEWAYTETVLEEGVVSMGRYDPRHALPDRWTLLSVDGRPPTDEERRRYAARKARDAGDGHDNNADMIRPGSLRLIGESDETWQFAFEPMDDGDDDGADFLSEVNGTLTVMKAGPYVASFELANEKPIRPARGVKISEFKTRIEFGPASAEGPIVPKSIDVRVRGRAFLAIGFDETEAVRFSAWEYAGVAR